MKYLSGKYGDVLSFQSELSSNEEIDNKDSNPEFEETLKEIDQVKEALQQVEKTAGPIKISKKSRYLVKISKQKPPNMGQMNLINSEDFSEIGKDTPKLNSENEDLEDAHTTYIYPKFDLSSESVENWLRSSDVKAPGERTLTRHTQTSFSDDFGESVLGSDRKLFSGFDLDKNQYYDPIPLTSQHSFKKDNEIPSVEVRSSNSWKLRSSKK